MLTYESFLTVDCLGACVVEGRGLDFCLGPAPSFNARPAWFAVKRETVGGAARRLPFDLALSIHSVHLICGHVHHFVRRILTCALLLEARQKDHALGHVVPKTTISVAATGAIEWLFGWRRCNSP